ncbi:unnamed protein product [Paramecium primaurelia]|uniref:Uncharacterized protein n=1 Tax=Paramecium primaurelia TaxID=5886 RepID=A0A8S1Q1T3_PARPR|nr:unnamed protein product [Paramecium primaurelia]
MGTSQSSLMLGQPLKYTKMGTHYPGSILERKILLTDEQVNTLTNFIRLKEKIMRQPIFLKIHAIQKDDSSIFCNSNNTIKIYTEFSEIDLSNEIRRRRIASQNFTNQELLYNLKQLIEAMAIYQTYNIQYNLSSNTLLFDKMIKIMDPYIFDVKSPQLPHYKDQLGSVYSSWPIGIILLEMITLNLMTNLVNIDGTLNTHLLSNLLEQINEPFLKQCLLCIFGGIQRPNYIQLRDDLNGQIIRLMPTFQLQPENIQHPTNFSIQEQSKYYEAISQQQLIIKTQSNQPIPLIPLAQSNLVINLNTVSQKKENIIPISTNRSNNQSVLQEKIEQIRATYFNHKNQQQPSQLYLYRKSPEKQSETSSTGSEDLKSYSNGLQIDLQSDPFCKERESDINTLSKQFNFQNEEYICETYLDGSIYEGFKRNQKKNGQGSIYYSDGGFYIGQWQNDVMNGYGSLYYPSGKLAYQGCWVNGKFQGKGMLFNENPKDCQDINYEDLTTIGDCWISYSGDFICDQKQGKGVLIFTNGDRFEGQFKENMINGPGTFKSGNKVISSIWSKNLIL